MSDKYFGYMDHLEQVAASDVAGIREKEQTYRGSWKRSGGRSAWFMVKRKIDRLVEMMTPPAPPPGWPTTVRVNADTTHALLRMTTAEDIFARVTNRPYGQDGTVLAEVRDLRRYLLLAEAEMVARGAVVLEGATHTPGTPEDGGHHARQGDPGDESGGLL